MSELTIIIDNWGHEELKEYLMSLKGILDVEIKNVEHEIKSDEQLDIYLKYDSSLITPKIIKMEITLFLNITKIPSILSFDKYPKFKTSNYTIIRDDLCCEYCYKGAIEDLFEIEGIETVKGNFNEDYLFKKYEEREKITINIEYNPNLLKAEDMKQIELKLNI
jgi:copper chaperone CopZ